MNNPAIDIINMFFLVSWIFPLKHLKEMVDNRVTQISYPTLRHTFREGHLVDEVKYIA
ncbi:hypothetical protein [Nitrosococcus watsonii]|uniref:hypothetical protein n=1 Tax=Nitrosococcus watsonii TaxID=473531 RepID=UPI000317D3B4|nr:hypothetical protein [Nitrosococcus watsonii]